MTQVSRKGFRDKNGKQVVIVSKVPGATAGNLASFDEKGNLQDSGKAIDTMPTANSANLVTSGGVKAALDGKTEMHNDNYGFVEIQDNGQIQVIGNQSVLIGISDMDAAVVTLNNIENLKRALLNPDSSPTANSTKFVTSGGVEAAIIPAIQSDQDLDNLYAGDTKHYIYTINDEYVGDGFLYLSSRSLRPGPGGLPIGRYYQTIVGAGGVKTRYSDNKAAYGEWDTHYYLTNYDVDATPTEDSTNLVTSGGVKAAVDAADAVHYKQIFYYISASDEISVANLVSGHTYAVRVRVQTSHFSDVFAETGINFCGLEGSTPNVTTAIFRYFSLETDVEGSYEHFISVLAYKTSSFEPM